MDEKGGVMDKQISYIALSIIGVHSIRYLIHHNATTVCVCEYVCIYMYYSSYGV